MTSNFSHANCNHPKTSKARAMCRRINATQGGALIAPPIVVPVDLLATAPDLLTTAEHMGRNDAQRIVTDMLRDHGLVGWRLVFINARRKAGHCNYARREIALSAPLMQQRSYADTHSTITHEVAHALTPGHNHDHVWAAMHRSMGGNGKRCFEHTDETAPYLGTCAAGTIHSKYRAPKHPDMHYRCKCPGASREGFTFVRNPNA